MYIYIYIYIIEREIVIYKSIFCEKTSTIGPGYDLVAMGEARAGSVVDVVMPTEQLLCHGYFGIVLGILFGIVFGIVLSCCLMFVARKGRYPKCPTNSLLFLVKWWETLGYPQIDKPMFVDGCWLVACSLIAGCIVFGSRQEWWLKQTWWYNEISWGWW